ncbi:O-antigen ligase family protein [Paenibacillus alkalitolerans]|uniref:O-antigen ligase family protein n=1 Tax=Paenibacillus alkalitolerans TaxID=2799335 RepID=UPI0018F3B550|nr:O-antigen ligase family protein [Paenibacillus alkalitolerans]
MQVPTKPRNSFQAHTGVNKEKSSLTYWATILFTFGFLLFSPFGRGLFDGSQASFDGAILTAEALMSFSVLSLSVFLFFTKRVSQRNQMIHHIVWLIPVAYLISIIFASSSHAATFSFWVYLFYAFVFTIGTYLSKSIFGSKVMISGIVGSAYIIVLFGLMNWFGDASIWGLFNWSEVSGYVSNIYKDAVMVDANGERLTSVFQYANSYAAFLIATILVTIVLIVSAKSRVVVGVASFMLVPALLSFILTLSRGGLVVFPIVLVLVLPFLKVTRQLLAILHLFIAGVVTLLILNALTVMGLALQKQFVPGDAFKAWALLIGCSAIVTATGLLIQWFAASWLEKKLQQVDVKRYTNLALPIVGIIVGALGIYLLLGNSGFVKMLPDNIQTRIENINLNQHSVLERGTFYQDAIKLWKDYPVFGAGGGAWQTLYEKYQNNPYTSRQAHNFFLQTLVEVGIVGSFALILLLGVVLYHFLRSYWIKQEGDRHPYLIFYTVAISILIHSIIDFNMSYVYLGALVFLCLGGMLAANELRPFRFQEKFSKSKWVYVYPSLLLVGSLVFLAVSLNNLASNNLYTQARHNAAQGASVDQITGPLDEAIGKLKHPEYVDLKLQVLNSLYQQTNDEQYVTEAEELLAMMKKREPYFKPFIYRELQLRLLQNKFPDAVALLEQSIPNFPWDMTLYEQLASVHFQYGIHLLQSQNADEAQAQWDTVFSVRVRVLDKAKALEALPEAQLQGRAFGITPGLALPLGQVYFFRGEIPQAEGMLRNAVDVNFDDSNDTAAAIYYLATLRKQSRDDQAVFDALLANFPDRQDQLKQQIDSLAKQIAIQ